jgi:hypothetical protein
VEKKLSEQSENSIREAVKACLNRCYEGATPLGVLAESLADLRERGWSESDVRQVEISVRKVLAGVMIKEGGI